MIPPDRVALLDDLRTIAEADRTDDLTVRERGWSCTCGASERLVGSARHASDARLAHWSASHGDGAVLRRGGA